MRGAADRCQRIGACRKTGQGVMCPSYMATREEEHATRGRANALVKALSEPDPRAALGDERLHEILDLCLECKACKSECPLSVDMATMKSEFLSHYQAQHGTPFRSKLFGAIRKLNRLGAATAPLSNLPIPRGLLERVAGIDRRRPLPRFARETLLRWDKQREPRRGAQGRRRLPRRLVHHLHRARHRPRRDRAARVGGLERAARERRLLRALEHLQGPARPGPGDGARRWSPGSPPRPSAASRSSAASRRACSRCARSTPACWPATRARRPSRTQTRLVEELLVEAIDDGSLQLDPNADVSNRPIVFHGHCHQKALAGTAATVALLERIPGAQVTELDAGCCGMAGSFGFETEHYELSMQIGESRLFPALREAAPGTLVSATGVSCRQQINHGVGQRAWHPVELVRAAQAA